MNTLYDLAVEVRVDDPRLRTLIAEHEAAHAVAAQQMGLPVDWVQIEPGFAEGTCFGAAVHIPDDALDLDEDMFKVCVAMAAPSFIVAHTHTDIGRYAKAEAGIAYQLAEQHGMSSGAVYDRAACIVDEYWQDILTLADRLIEEGRVEF